MLSESIFTEAYFDYLVFNLVSVYELNKTMESYEVDFLLSCFAVYMYLLTYSQIAFFSV